MITTTGTKTTYVHNMTKVKVTCIVSVNVLIYGSYGLEYGSYGHGPLNPSTLPFTASNNTVNLTH
jgi:hypothetical protein